MHRHVYKHVCGHVYSRCISQSWIDLVSVTHAADHTSFRQLAELIMRRPDAAEVVYARDHVRNRTSGEKMWRHELWPRIVTGAYPFSAPNKPVCNMKQECGPFACVCTQTHAQKRRFLRPDGGRTPFSTVHGIPALQKAPLLRLTFPHNHDKFAVGERVPIEGQFDEELFPLIKAQQLLWCVLGLHITQERRRQVGTRYACFRIMAMD